MQHAYFRRALLMKRRSYEVKATIALPFRSSLTTLVPTWDNGKEICQKVLCTLSVFFLIWPVASYLFSFPSSSSLDLASSVITKNNFLYMRRYSLKNTDDLEGKRAQKTKCAPSPPQRPLYIVGRAQKWEKESGRGTIGRRKRGSLFPLPIVPRSLFFKLGYQRDVR